MTPRKTNSLSIKTFRCLGLALTALLLGSSFANASTTVRPPQNDYGINLYAPKDWNRMQPFMNVMETARPWISQTSSSWDDKRSFDLDEKGYVRSLKEGQHAGTILLTNIGETFPGGEYIFLYDGEGTFEWKGNGRLVSSRPGRQVVEVTNTDKGFTHMVITEVNPRDYPRNFRFVHHRFERDLENGEFLVPWLSTYYGNVEAIRYMDLTLANNSKVSKWEDRPMIGDRSFWEDGIPWERIIEMSNTLNKDAWINIPHLATDDFIRKTAELFRDEMKPGLTVYYEFSNEVWNGMFGQTRYANEQGSKIDGLGPEGWRAGLQYHALQTIRMNRILDEVYAREPRDRYVKVLGVQAGNLGAARVVAEHANVAESTDALAIAPYMSFNVPMKSTRWGKVPPAAEVETWTIDQLFEWLQSESLPECLRWMDEQKKMADRLGLELIAYEGGQHLSALGEANRNKTLIDLMAQANRDPRMGALYDEYFAHWTAIGGGLFCVFNAMQPYSNAGFWGTLEYVGQDPESSPKYQAIQRWVGQQ